VRVLLALLLPIPVTALGIFLVSNRTNGSIVTSGKTRRAPNCPGRPRMEPPPPLSVNASVTSVTSNAGNA